MCDRGFFTFETPLALGQGIVRLLKDPNANTSEANTNDPAAGWKALTLSLTMSSLKQYPELAKSSRPKGTAHTPTLSSKNWLELREEESEFTHQDPQVIIVGSGHGGLMLAARLKRLGVKTLLVDKVKRLGDSWRLRYKTLVLHDFIWANYFPYLKYPDDWPVFIPKDKIAGWFESYASIMELNVVCVSFICFTVNCVGSSWLTRDVFLQWTDSTVEPDSTVYDDATGTWSLKIRRGDGTIRDLKCHQIVQATGHSCVLLAIKTQSLYILTRDDHYQRRA